MPLASANRPAGGGLVLPRMAFGGGSLFPVAREREAVDVLNAAYERGFRHFDTAPLYASGLSEHWFGAALRQHPREEFTLSTKVGRRLRPHCETPTPTDRLSFDIEYDYTFDGALRSLEDSLQRLGLCRVDLALIHDVNPRWHGENYERRFAEAMKGAYPALERLRSEGVVRAIGVGVKGADVCLRFAREGNFDFFMLAGGYTLLEHAALNEFFPHCVANDIGVIVASPFNSGILATGPSANATFFYTAPPQDVIDRVARMQTVCGQYGVPLGAAALQFTLAHPAVVCALCGYRSVHEVETNLRWIDWPIPSALWDALKDEQLIPGNAPTPQARDTIA